MVSFVHGLGAFFVRVNAGAFIVDVVSGRVRKVADNRRARCFVPYTSFCIPGISSITFLFQGHPCMLFLHNTFLLKRDSVLTSSENKHSREVIFLKEIHLEI